MDNNTRLALNITDTRLEFDPDPKYKSQPMSREMTDKGEANVWHCVLTYEMTCPKCSTVMSRNGYKSVMYQSAQNGTSLIFFKIKKQKYICKCCKNTELAELSDVRKGDHLFRDVKQIIAMQIEENMSMTTIAKINNVSSNTVIRSILGLACYIKPSFHYLSRNIAFDDFKSGKFAKSGYSLLLMNIETHQPIDVISDRGDHSLEKYFLRYSPAARAAVRTVTVDLFSPYRSTIQKVFPNAIIIADHFHVVVQAFKGLNQLRIKVMKSFKYGSPEYRQLNRFWKLIMKSESDLNRSDRYKRCNFKNLQLTDDEVVNRLLSLSEELRAAYNFYQNLIFIIHNQSSERLKTLLWQEDDKNSAILPQEMDAAIKTLRKHFEEIINSFKTKYCHFSTGPVEGCNNKIKVIKRTAYGFRNFYHFKIRILIAFKNSFYSKNFISLTKQQKTANSPTTEKLAA